MTTRIQPAPFSVKKELAELIASRSKTPELIARHLFDKAVKELEAEGYPQLDCAKKEHQWKVVSQEQLSLFKEIFAKELDQCVLSHLSEPEAQSMLERRKNGQNEKVSLEYEKRYLFFFFTVLAKLTSMTRLWPLDIATALEKTEPAPTPFKNLLDDDDWIKQPFFCKFDLLPLFSS